MPSSWPSTTDLTSFLGAISGLTYSSGLVTSSRVTAAVRWLERETGWIPFQGASATRTFDPPGSGASYLANYKGGERFLRLDAGLVSVTSMTVGTTAFTEGTDFWLMGNSAPYQVIEFAVPVLGAARSVSIVGVWGFCAAASIPDDAWQAVLYHAAGEVMLFDKQAKLQKAVEWKIGDASKRYGFENTNQLGQSFLDDAKMIASQFKRVTVGV